MFEWKNRMPSPHLLVETRKVATIFDLVNTASLEKHMIILERHSVVTSLAIKESPEITKNKSDVAQIIPSPVEVRPYLVRGSYLYRGSSLDRAQTPTWWIKLGLGQVIAPIS